MSDQLPAEKLKKLQTQILNALAKTKSSKDLTELRVSHLGRKSALNLLLRGLSGLSSEKKREIGTRANQIKEALERAFNERDEAIRRSEITAEMQQGHDLTLPGVPYIHGHRHPLNTLAEEMAKVFKKMGFSYVEGSEIESDDNNFTLLNIPRDHPAREMQDTFYLQGSGVNRSNGRASLKAMAQGSENKKWLLRTHTTPVWIPVMKNAPPPYRAFTCGKVFRRDAIDPTHLPFFHQMDAFAIDENLSMADLKSTLEIWAAEVFGAESKVRFRPSYFPFTEPSCEVEVQCFLCQGRTCSTCKNGWIELLGAGMIHPEILKSLGHDPARWRGFAFGLGLERVAMVTFGIPDIRSLYENDIRFLEQFTL